MFWTLNGLIFSLLLSFLGEIFSVTCSSFSIEELSSNKYEVEVSKLPLKKVESQAVPVMQVTSSSGIEYQCMLPYMKEKESEKVGDKEKSINIENLLKPMYAGNCLYKVTGWWTYELCFGLVIKQFHIEDGRISGRILTLGMYESDYDWSNDINEEKFNYMKQRYHSQSYVNGTDCDLTGLPRTAEVRIFCKEDSLDFIKLVDEPETCSYIFIVYTSLVCSHPLLKSSKEAHKIPCHPLWSDEQEITYLEKEEILGIHPEPFHNVWKID